MRPLADRPERAGLLHDPPPDLDRGAFDGLIVEVDGGDITRDLPKGRRLGPVQGFVIPTLRRCGLLSERVAAHFHGFLRENFGGAVVGEDVDEFLRWLPALPADTAAWVLGELQ